MPELRVDVDAIGRNTEAVAALLSSHGLDLIAVTKGCLGEPRVAAAMMAGGAVAIADTRDLNLRGLRAALPHVELHRIHLPSFTEPFEPGDVTYVSSREGAAVVAGLGPVGGAAAGPRRVMVQVETGDEREGAPLDGLGELVAGIAADPRLRLLGLSTNYACFKGTPAGIRQSVESLAAATVALRAAGQTVERVSGGNSSLLSLLVAGERLPDEVTELRCGEALLLGQDALFYRPLPGCRTDACLLRAEVVEEYTKRLLKNGAAPSERDGYAREKDARSANSSAICATEDELSCRPVRSEGRGFVVQQPSRPSSLGLARRLVLGIGRQDLGAGAVRFKEPGLVELGRSADYLVVEAGDECPPVALGTMIDMIPSYEALVAAWTSPYVELTLLLGS